MFLPIQLLTLVITVVHRFALTTLDTGTSLLAVLASPDVSSRDVVSYQVVKSVFLLRGTDTEVLLVAVVTVV